MEEVKVLYVDDDNMDRMRCERLFKHMEHLNGQTTEVFEPSSWDLFDFVVLDLNMGAVDIKEILELASLKVFVVSGHSSISQVYDKTDLPIILSDLTRIQISYGLFEDIQPDNTALHKELKEVSLTALRNRLEMWEQFYVDAMGFEELRHKTLSTFKSCGMVSSVLEVMKKAEDITERIRLSLILKHQIKIAIAQLESHLRTNYK